MTLRPLNLEHIGHQHLAQIEAAVEATVGVGYIRLDWMKLDHEPFEIKAFVLEQLGQVHAVMCEAGTHAPGPPKDGKLTSSDCPWCDYEGSTF